MGSPAVRPSGIRWSGSGRALRGGSAVQYTREAVVGVVRRQQPDLVSGLEKLLGQRLRVAPDTTRIRVRVGRYQGYAHPAHPIGHT